MLPVEEGSRGFLQQADRKDHVGPLGHLGKPLLQGDHETTVLNGLAGSCRIGHVSQFHPRDDEGRELAAAGSGQHAGGVEAGLGRQVVDSPRDRDVHASIGVVDETSTGKQLRQQAGLDRSDLTGTTRHPGDPDLRVEGGDGREGSGPGGGPLPHQHDGSLADRAV